jgi:hypothetical protein
MTQRGQNPMFGNDLRKQRKEPRTMLRTRRSVDAVLIAIAIVSRIGAVWVLQSHLVPRSTYEHGEIASNLLAGRGFAIKFLGADGPTSQQAPVYPAIVAAAYAIGGIETPRSLFLLETGQSVLGGLLVLGVLHLCRSLVPGRKWMAWTAGLVVALHPTLVYAATHVQVATLATTLLTWTMAWAYQTGASVRRRDALITGGLLGLLTLTDPILALSAVGVIWAIWQTGSGIPRDLRRSLGLIVVVVIVSLISISPWLVRNALVHGEFVAIKSTFGYAFWQGNCALSEGTDKVVRPSVEHMLDRDPAESTQSGLNGKLSGRRDVGLTSDFDELSRVASSTRLSSPKSVESESPTYGSTLSGLNRTLWEARHEAGYLDDIALTKADFRLLGSVSEPERSRILFSRAISDLKADPVRYVRLCLRRLRYFIFFDETNPKTRVLAYRVPHVMLTGFALIGLLLTPPSVRKRLGPTIAAVALIALFHSLTIVSTRFHIPIEPLLAIWGAAGLVSYDGQSVRGGYYSATAGHHVERVRLVDRLAVVHGGAGFLLLRRPTVHECQPQAGEHGAGANQDSTPPGDAWHDGGISPR